MNVIDAAYQTEEAISLDNPLLQIRLATSPQINFACHQNAVPVIREIELVNNSGDTFHNLTLELRSSPSFIAPKHWHIDRLQNGTLHIIDRDTRLDGEYLLKLLEQQRGELTFRLRNSEGEVLAEQNRDVELLARNEWGGYGASPELLAAFCMPNEKSVEKLLRFASELLRKNGQDGMLKNYEKGDPKRIWLQASAIWNTVLAMNLDYAYPPSSFERTGQKVRTPDAILEGRRATCLDATLLFAALFEQMRLNPIVVLDEGHAYVGLWLRDEGFARPYINDLLALRKRVQLKEVIVIETTLVCQRTAFKTAIKHAEDNLLNDKTQFVGLVDIARARDEQIRPLSYVRHSHLQQEIARSTSSEPSDEEPLPVSLDVPDDAERLGGDAVEWSHVSAGPGGRLGHWQRKLLDLTLRNPLLSMRASKTNIPLLAPDVGKLEDTLAEGKSLSIEPAPTHGARDEELHTQQTGDKLDEQVALAALKRGKIYSPIDQQKLEAALVDLYRKAKNDLEEGGANTLFLAIGILHWQRPGAGERTFRAPLVLIPVNITRQSIRSGIRLTLNDDEPRFNTTLLEMLRQDFDLDIKGLDGPLPADHSGTDIDAILTRMRQEVKEVAGFEVRNEVVLGTFSFAKYLMWKDLIDRTDKLKDNAVVRHLIDSPKEPFAQAGTFREPRELDSVTSRSELFTPLSYDSSQLAAVVASAEEKNFVMIGPPGTGKSQTIANIIAHNLGLGRTVLFVSEKAAALDVVFRRLREQGLGEFCLELHSNKARKLDVLKQLGEAWQVRSHYSQDDWARETQQLQQVRDELNQLVNALHEKHRNGSSIRTALGVAVSMADVPQIKLSWSNADVHDQDGYARLLAVGERIDLNAKEIGIIAGHPLGLLHNKDWSLSWQQSVLDQAIQLATQGSALLEQIAQLSKRLQLNELESILDKNRLSALSRLAKAIANTAGKDLSFAFAPNVNETHKDIDSASELLSRFQQVFATLSCTYDRSCLLAFDHAAAQTLWNKSKSAWWLPRKIKEYQCRKLLMVHAGAAAKPDPEADLPHVQTLQLLDKEMAALAVQLEQVPGWRGLDSDIGIMKAHAELSTQIRGAMAALAKDADALVKLKAVVRGLVIDANEMLGTDGVLGAQLSRFIDSVSAFHESLVSFAALASRNADELLALPAGLNDLLASCKQLGSAQQKMNAWCAWRRVRAEAVDLGLLPIVDAIERGQIAAGDAHRNIEANYARWWVAQKIDASAVIRNFVAVEHERKILNFRELDAKVREITAQAIRTRVRQGLVEKDAVGKSSQFGVIRRELEKRARHKPLRQLLSETSSAISALTPCLLMSPLSIAQYLPVDQKPFDLVIFDEASQITVWDAIGAIARGKQTIVVGDPKQLPPTRFFSADHSDDETQEEADLESILDEMLGANLPTINLSWHYRSRHESLITFSNHRYYKGELITFPSPVTEDRAVSLEFVGGTYDRGNSQTNRAEADRIVAEIERRLTDPATSKQTLGVVTFNQKQQTLILDLLDAARRNNPDLDQFFAEELIEPVFVKNLESVQGDERDVILFSTTFGPDNTGRIAMNFGPLNQSGGERRLNVAITRARCELKVFSSMRAEQIDLSRTAAIGVRDLKHFLEFAERGARALAEAVFGSVGDFDSPFEASVARALQEKGWTVHPQVGVSQFRIDLGIVDPHAPGNYLAGIECDGATYHRSATARDRDMVRESVLRGLGWEILRLWSTDYWIDPVGAIEKLHLQLGRAKNIKISKFGK
jgi:hypothetical protein